jgi:uncharacterized protein
MAWAHQEEAAAQYLTASRVDLAVKEQEEATLLSGLLPPLLSEDEIDRHLRGAIEEAGAKDVKSLGLVLKAFYSRVDSLIVDKNLVKRRLQFLLSSGDN